MTDVRETGVREVDPGGERPGAGGALLPLPRLLAVARLSPAQAVELAAGVLAALDDGAGEVGVDRDGRVRLLRQGGSGTASAGLLAGLADAARVPGQEPDHRTVRLAEVAAALPDRGPAWAAAELAVLRGGTDGAATRGELAALVAAAGPAVLGARPDRPVPAGPPRDRPAGRPIPRAPDARGRGPGRRMLDRAWKWGLSLLVLAAVVAAEIVFLRDDIARDVALVLEAGRADPAEEVDEVAAPPAAAVPPVPPFAPPASGAVHGVDLRALRPCEPGVPCTVRVLVRLEPRPEPQTVAWSFRVVDGCTGAVEEAPGGTLEVPRGADRADAVATVTPAAGGSALVAVTDRPAAAASPALPVTGPGGCAPAAAP